MWAKRLMGIGLLVQLITVLAVRADPVPATQILADYFRVGPLYTKSAGEVSVVVGLPYGITRPAASSYSLQFEGRPEVKAFEVKSFLDSGNELSWLICVDVSGSMARTPLQEAKKALYDLLSDGRALRVGLMAFGSQFSQPKFIDSRDNLMRALESLRDQGPKSQTKLYQAVYHALDFYQEKAATLALPQRRRILVISDGKDEGSSLGIDSVIKRSIAMGIPVDAVAISRIENQFSESLRHLAAATGGRFIDVRSDHISLKDAFSRIYWELIETQTVVAYFRYSPGEPAESANQVKLVLRLQGGQSLEGNINTRIPLPRSEEKPQVPSPPPVSIVEPQPPPPISSPVTNKFPAWLMWLAAGLLLALLGSLAALIAYRYRSAQSAETDGSQTSGIDSPAVSPDDASRPATLGVSVEEKSSVDSSGSERKTVVGGNFRRPEPGNHAAILLALSGPLEGLESPIETEIFNIGANSENTLVIAEDSYVSGAHACIRFENGNLLIFDLDSRNGTYVNDKRLLSDAQALLPGDVIRMGASRFQIIE